MRRHVLVLGLALAALGASGCSESAGVEAADLEARSTATLSCADPIDILDEPPDGWTVVADVIALPNDGVLQRGRYDDELGRSFSKFGLAIRADRAFTIRVGTESQPNTLIGWGTNSSAPSATIHVPGCGGRCDTDWQPSCPLGTTGDWLVFPGGVWTIEAGCVTIEITIDAETTEVELPIGIGCG